MSLSHLPRIVTKGLVVCLDAGDRKSYSGSGTTWKDRATQNNGTLYNGPTFNSTNGGLLSFDGVDDYLQADVNTTALDGDPSLSVDMFVRRRTGTNIGGSAGFGRVGGVGR